MKIVKIFGAVLALHGLAFLLIFANPGCSSTKKAPLAADSPAVAPAPEAAPMINLAAMPAVAINPTGNPAVAAGFDPDAPAVSGLERYSPKRPGPESAAPAPAPEAAPAKTYTVAGGDSLWTIAKKNDISVSELSRANNLASSAVIRPGQKLVIPVKNAPAANGAQGAGANASASGAGYRVKANETLAGIAKRAGVPAATLRELNGLKTDALRVGQELKLPPGTTVAAESPAAKPSDSSFTHVVQPGETLETIARKYGMKTGDLGAANNISNPALIRAGATLVIPGWQPAAKAASPEPAPKAPVIQIPGVGQDLSSGLKSAPSAAPVIRIDTPIIPAK
jgi:LysM repeat protein